MRKTKSIKPVVLNPDLEKALKGFVPFFGNQEDMWIVERLGKVKELLGTIDCDAFRKAEQSRDPKKLSPKMKDIQRDEQNLIYSIIKRNMDF